MKSKLIVLFLSTVSFIVKGQTVYPPFTDIGFENLSTGVLASAWATGSVSLSNTAVACLPNSYWFYSPAPNAIVVSTPYADTNVNNVENSPFPGTNVVMINRWSYATANKISQTFSVTASNFVYRYAYKGYHESNHNLCMGGAIVFRFFDSNNTLISSLSKTVSMNGGQIDNSSWISSGAQSAYKYTPIWVTHEENLLQYIGSNIRVEVLAGSCYCGGYWGYCYYDSESGSNFLQANGLIRSATYTSCLPNTTLSGLGGFSSYLWQGPANSGVSGSTLSSLSTSVSGTYTLTASSGTNSFTQVLNLTVSSPPSATLSALGAGSICLGNSTQLQLSGNYNSFTWNAGTISNTAVVSPTATSIYTATVGNASGCTATLSVPVLVNPLPVVQLSASNQTICQGQSTSLSASGNGISYNWNTFASTQSISVSPSVTTVYVVTATSGFGCKDSASIIVSVKPAPQIQILATPAAICTGQSATLSVTGSSLATYAWSNGSQTPVITVNPITTTNYGVLATGNNGCSGTGTIALTVNSLPLVSITSDISGICAGESVQLNAITNASPAVYNWSNGNTNGSMVVSPLQSSTYSLTVMNALTGCGNTASISIQVNLCTGISNHSNSKESVHVFPNPANGSFTIKGSTAQTVIITDELGRKVLEIQLSPQNQYTQRIDQLTKGVYFMRVGAQVNKIVLN